MPAMRTSDKKESSIKKYVIYHMRVLDGLIFSHQFYDSFPLRC